MLEFPKKKKQPTVGHNILSTKLPNLFAMFPGDDSFWRVVFGIIYYRMVINIATYIYIYINT